MHRSGGRYGTSRPIVRQVSGSRLPRVVVTASVQYQAFADRDAGRGVVHK